MDRAGIRRAADHAVQRVDLAHKVALAQSADRRIAAHRADRLRIEGDERDPQSHARAYRCGLYARMPSTDDDDIELRHRSRIRAPHAQGQSRSRP